MRVLFVCLGNICRSPTAEAVFRARLDSTELSTRVQCDSAGTAGYHAGEAPDRRATESAQRRGYDMRHLRARQVRDEDFDVFDLILAMDHNNLADLRRRADGRLHHKLKLFLEFTTAPVLEVPDPYYGGPEGFDHVLDLVESASDGLILHLRERLAP